MIYTLFNRSFIINKIMGGTCFWELKLLLKRTNTDQIRLNRYELNVKVMLKLKLV